MSRRRKTLTLIFLSLLSVSAMFYMLSARHASESQKAPIVRANDARIEVAPLRKEVRGREREIEVHTTHKALKVDDNAKKSHNNVVKSLEAKKATKPTLEKLEVKNKPKTPMEKKKKTKPRKLKLEELSEEEKSLIISKQCAAGVCLPRNQLSSPEEVKRHDDCLLEAYWYVKDQQLLNGKNMSLSKCSCKLHSSKPKYGRVALVSLPGSGNTWARGLLQQATDLCTSAMWCDPNLRATKFCGEGLHSGKTLVVKNHDATVRWRGLPLTKGQSENNKPEFDAVIFVHRDPYEAMVAEHNREVAHDLWVQAIKENRSIHSTSHSVHVQHFGPEFFGEPISEHDAVEPSTLGLQWNPSIVATIGE